VPRVDAGRETASAAATIAGTGTAADDDYIIVVSTAADGRHDPALRRDPEVPIGSFDDCPRLHISIVCPVEDQYPIVGTDADQVTNRVHNNVPRVLQHGVWSPDDTKGRHVAIGEPGEYQDVLFPWSISTFDNEDFVVDRIHDIAVPRGLKLRVWALNYPKGRLVSVGPSP
jgi:hypothetical protein